MTNQWQAEATPEDCTRVPHTGCSSVQYGTVGQPKLPVLYLLCMLRGWIKIYISKEERRRSGDPPTSSI
jgi:hypothetical protein